MYAYSTVSVCQHSTSSFPTAYEWPTLVTRYCKRVYYQFYFRRKSTDEIYKQHVYINISAYLIAVYDTYVSQYIRFVGYQLFLKYFLQFISGNEDQYSKIKSFYKSFYNFCFIFNESLYEILNWIKMIYN